jgi:hypothetical protein
MQDNGPKNESSEKKIEVDKNALESKIKSIFDNVFSILNSDEMKNLFISLNYFPPASNFPGLTNKRIEIYHNYFCKKIKCSLIYTIISFIIGISLISSGGVISLFCSSVINLPFGLGTLILAGLVCIIISFRFLYIYRSSLNHYYELSTLNNNVLMAQHLIQNLSLNKRDSAYEEIIKKISELINGGTTSV